MNVLAASELTSDHLTLIISSVALVSTLILGILQFRGASKKSDAQTIECHYEHTAMADALSRLNLQSEAIMNNQRQISTALDRVAVVLERMMEKMDDTIHNK